MAKVLLQRKLLASKYARISGLQRYFWSDAQLRPGTYVNSYVIVRLAEKYLWFESQVVKEHNPAK